MLPQEIVQTGSIILHQRRELGELLGVETRNKYSIETEDGRSLGFAAEQQKGLFGFLLRQLVGHWRTFELHFFDSERRLFARAVHPFRWIFQCLEVYGADGALIGAIEQRFAVLHKSFDVRAPSGRVLMQVRSPLFSPWTFSFDKHGRECAVVEKKWSGLLTEVFTDADRFRIRLSDGSLTAEERLLILAAGVFVDLQYFEKKADR